MTRRAAIGAAGVLGGIAALGLLALLILTLIIPADDVRRAAGDAISSASGHKVTIEGEPAIGLLPSPRLKLGKVVLPLPEGQSFDAADVVARLRVLPLLLGRVSIADVTLERPTLVLTGKGSLPAIPLAALLGGTDLPELRIKDGTVVWRSPEGLTQELVSGIAASLDRVRDGKGVAAGAAFTWRDANVDIKLLMDDADAFLGGMPTPTRLSASADDDTLSFRGVAARGDGLIAEGGLTASVASLRHLLGWIGTPVPTAGGFGPARVSATLKAAHGAATLSDTTFSLDGNRTEGGLVVDLSSGRPVIQGTFAADRMDLTPYGRMPLTSSNGRDWNRQRIGLSLLKDFDLDLRLSAAEVTADRSRFETVAASAVLNAGRLVVAIGQATGWDGLLRAAATLVPTTTADGETGAAIRIEAEGTDLALEKALWDLAEIRRLEGIGTLQAELEGTGGSVAEIARHLSGTLTLSSRTGAIVGFDAAQVLRRIERRPLSSGGDPWGGRTAFTDLDARLVIANGEADLEEMRLQGDKVRLTMAGTLSVADRDLDLTGTATLVSAAAAAGGKDFELPFVVQGPWSNPFIWADPKSLIERSGAAQSLWEAVRGHPADGPGTAAVDTLVPAPAPLPASTTVATPALPAAPEGN